MAYGQSLAVWDTMMIDYWIRHLSAEGETYTAWPVAPAGAAAVPLRSVSKKPLPPFDAPPGKQIAKCGGVPGQTLWTKTRLEAGRLRFWDRKYDGPA